MSIRITQHVDFSVTADQSRYCLAIVNKYLAGATIAPDDKRHNRTLPNDFVFTRDDASENDVQIEELMRQSLRLHP